MTIIREIRVKNWKLSTLTLGVATASFAVSAAFAPLPYIRKSDLKAYGIAAVSTPVKLMISGKFKDANKILTPLATDNPQNPYIQLEYASSLLGTGKPQKALAILVEMTPPCERHLTARRYFEIAEANRLLGNIQIARQFYTQSLRLGISGFRKTIALRNTKSK
jgi:hypothetical protein